MAVLGVASVVDSSTRPVFEAAIAAHGVLRAGGLDREDAMRIAKDGLAAFDPELDRLFGLGAALPAGVQTAMRAEMRESHCGLLPDAMLDSMVLVQRARDALLAERVHEGRGRGHGALLIAGHGHVRRDRGGAGPTVARVRGAVGRDRALGGKNGDHDCRRLCVEPRGKRVTVRLRLVHPPHERRRPLRGATRAHEDDRESEAEREEGRRAVGRRARRLHAAPSGVARRIRILVDVNAVLARIARAGHRIDDPRPVRSEVVDAVRSHLDGPRRESFVGHVDGLEIRDAVGPSCGEIVVVVVEDSAPP